METAVVGLLIKEQATHANAKDTFGCPFSMPGVKESAELQKSDSFHTLALKSILIFQTRYAIIIIV